MTPLINVCVSPLPSPLRRAVRHGNEGRRQVERVRERVYRAAERVALALRLGLMVRDHAPALRLGRANCGLHRPSMGLDELDIGGDGLDRILNRRAPPRVLLIDRLEPLLQLLIV